jgi:hypothetical protein
MANDNDMDTPIPFESPVSRPLGEPQPSDFGSESTCDICGLSFNGKHGVNMHKTIVHGVKGQRKRGRPKGSTNKPKPPAPRPPKRQAVILNEVYTDGGENGRILLTDQYGNWWVARKLDV